MSLFRRTWATYGWTLDGQRIEVVAPDRASARVAALNVVDTMLAHGRLTDRRWTAWQTRIQSESPQREKRAVFS